jgi:hypothetical protein
MQANTLWWSFIEVEATDRFPHIATKVTPRIALRKNVLR